MTQLAKRSHAMNLYRSMTYNFLQSSHDVPLQKGLQRTPQRTP